MAGFTYGDGFDSGMKHGYNTAKHDIARHILNVVDAPEDNDVHFPERFKLQSLRAYAEMLLGKS